ncbi:choice-of-anchor N protein [Gemmatimonas aurantiaca]|nr:choice-of-anchor N protein [Gemmatimonas aurantiaca]
MKIMKSTITKGLATLAAAFVLTGTAQALPSLQIYIPGSTYDAVTETWITTATSFEVWVIASEPMYGVQLTASLGADEDPYAGTLDIGGASYSGADFTNGAHDLLAPHGVFPSDWVNHAVGDMTTMTANTITNFDPDYDDGVTPFTQTGQIMVFNVTMTGFRNVHFDAWGYDGRDMFNFAPFSHDAGSAVPEPATALLLTLGAAGMGVVRKFRKKN